jgi:hypothetical protein
MGAKLLLLARLAKKNYQKPCFPPRFVDISKKKELGAFVICKTKRACLLGQTLCVSVLFGFRLRHYFFLLTFL